MSAIVELARPGNAAMASFSALLGMLVVMGPDLADAEMIVPVILGMWVPFSVTAGGNALNDYMDHQVDRMAHPERPIPSGRLAPERALWFALGCFIEAVVVAALLVTFTDIDLLPLLIAVLAVTSLVGYEIAFKYRGLGGNVTVAYLSALTFVFGASVVAEPDHEAWATVLILFTLAFFASAGREVTKDIQDMDADMGSRVTLPMTTGVGLAAGIASIFIVAAVAMSPFPFWPLETMGWPYLAVVLVADVVFLYSLPLVRKEPAGAQRLHKYAMVLALLAFLVGSLVEG
ncbi:MAG: UbiA family prenyltransferase [Thermoplasmata archaeon]|nr:MAG: UbiA family prenyltransferase [Thermoplasmata archaeon]